MRARLVTPENKKWWTLAAVAVGLFMIMLDNTVVNVALPSMQALASHVAVGARVGGRRLRADVRRVHAHRRQARRLRRSPADLHGRPRRLHRRESRVRSRAERRLPDRRASRPGPRRCADEPGDALDHHGDVPAARARQGDRHLGRRVRRWRLRSARSSAACSPSTSTGTGSSSSTCRSGSSACSRLPALHRRVARHVARAAARRARPGRPRRSASSR